MKGGKGSLIANEPQTMPLGTTKNNGGQKGQTSSWVKKGKTGGGRKARKRRCKVAKRGDWGREGKVKTSIY